MTRLKDLDREQRRVLETLVRIGRRRKESFPKLVAAVSTGLVEQSLHNRPGGEGTSSGWRQETASSYPNVNRLNLKGSVNRFYDEADRVGLSHYGDIAATVQRPAAQYRGRYREHGEEAKNLIRELSKARGKVGAPGSGRAGGARSEDGTRSITVPGTDRSAQRQALMLGYLHERGRPSALLSLASGLKGAQDTPARVRTVKTKAPERVAPKPAGGPVNQIIQAGEYLQKLGYNIRENPHFDPVDPVHVRGSKHYVRRAIDVPVSGSGGRRVVELLQTHFPDVQWIWNGPQPKSARGKISYPHGHTGHVHAQL